MSEFSDKFVCKSSGSLQWRHMSTQIVENIPGFIQIFTTLSSSDSISQNYIVSND